MGRVAILADDLTGALDAAAPFAGRSRTVIVGWNLAEVSGSERFALDTETRALPKAEAAARVAALLPLLRQEGIGFKKIDSLMRGNTMAELEACAGSGDFNTILIAPAFPEQGRITRGGIQFQSRDGGLQPIGLDVAARLAQLGIAVTAVGRDGVLPGRGVALCDAETPADLVHLVQQARALTSPVLWCGSGGLARALALPLVTPPPLPAGTRLFVSGTRHPVAEGQMRRLRQTMGAAVATIASSADAAGAIATIGKLIDADRSSALHFALPPLDPLVAEALFRDAFARLAELPPPDVVVVVGGDTLFRLCTAVGAGSLDAIGEWSPGIPMARIIGGVWSGATLVSKSGAFGDGDFLIRLLDSGNGSISRSHAPRA